ncbi:SUKH-3 domain-containing protein [Crossiella sp. CA198]|uniref:SUKH-3 domain-containing protein n=1 Tax=Crossiella sp. CA198 TaxID=3455607 RepID=UPI003F8CFA4D
MGGRFPAEVQSLLVCAGWYQGRAVDVEPSLMAWRSLGLDADSGPTGFVSEFDGLSFQHPPTVEAEGIQYPDHTCFDAVRAVRGISPRMHQEYSGLAGVSVYPVGENRSHMTLMIGASGVLFFGVDNYLFSYSGDIEASLVDIFTSVPPVLIGEWSL